MGLFFVYILKTTVCLAIFYLFYKLLLSRETFHSFNRFALMGILLLSTLLPFSETLYNNVRTKQTTSLEVADIEDAAVASPIYEVSNTTVEEKNNYLIVTLLSMYGLGILFFAGRNIYSFTQLTRVTRQGTKENFRDYFTKEDQQKPLLQSKAQLFRIEEKVSPFSWMNYIVVSREDLNENGKEILCHELAHIRKRHTIDLLIADICICLQWFNPAAWLLKKELQNIHEFEADEAVIQEGINIKDYQLLLIKKAVGSRLYSIANSFNHSKLKKRITMMMRKKSNPWARMKYLYLLPATAVTLTVFAHPKISTLSHEISNVKVSNFTATEKTEGTDLTQVPASKNILVEGVIIDNETGSPIHGVSVIIRNTAKGTLSDKNGQFKIEAPEGSVLVVSYIGKQTNSIVVKGSNNSSSMKTKIMLREETIQTDEIVVVAYNLPDKKEQETPQEPAKEIIQEEAIFTVVEEMPQFPGGQKEFLTFLAKNIKYPTDAQEGNIQGLVTVGFVVQADGSISDLEIVKSVSPSLDAEAIRVLSKMPKWSPARQRGKAVSVRYTTPIKFILQKPQTSTTK